LSPIRASGLPVTRELAHGEQVLTFRMASTAGRHADTGHGASPGMRNTREGSNAEDRARVGDGVGVDTADAASPAPGTTTIDSAASAPVTGTALLGSTVP